MRKSGEVETFKRMSGDKKKKRPQRRIEKVTGKVVEETSL